MKMANKRLKSVKYNLSNFFNSLIFKFLNQILQHEFRNQTKKSAN